MQKTLLQCGVNYTRDNKYKQLYTVCKTRCRSIRKILLLFKWLNLSFLLVLIPNLNICGQYDTVWWL
jgi:hypothetical protein